MSDIPQAVTQEPLKQDPVSVYKKLITDIDVDPFKPTVWDRVLSQASSEENTLRAKAGFIGKIPLVEMIPMAEKLRDAESIEDKFVLLAQTSSSGESWYDIILGHVNDYTLEVVGRYIGDRRWARGLDLGSGYGNSVLEIQKHVDSFAGIDRSILLQTVARAKSQLAHADLPVADAMRLPFADRSFDVAISNGLTHYIPEEQNQKFISELWRVLSPGGSYIEAFPFKNTQDVVAHVERGALESGKSVFAYLMDSLVTWQKKEPGQSALQFGRFVTAFKNKGFMISQFKDTDHNILVLEFTKPYSEELNFALRDLFHGETYEAQSSIYHFLYGDAAVDAETGRGLEVSKLPVKEEIISALKEYKLFSVDPHTVKAGGIGVYTGACINPLKAFVRSQEVDQDIRREAMHIFAENLTQVRTRLLANSNKRHWEVTGAIRNFRDMKERFAQEPGCEEVVTLLQTIISENMPPQTA